MASRGDTKLKNEVVSVRLFINCGDQFRSIGYLIKGPFKCYVTPCGWEGVSSPGKKKCYEDVRFNVINVTRGGGRGQIPWKKALHNT